jgi:hypothetical protein
LSTATRTAVSSLDSFTDTESVRSGSDPTVIDSVGVSESPSTLSATAGSDDAGAGVVAVIIGIMNKPVAMMIVKARVKTTAEKEFS